MTRVVLISNGGFKQQVGKYSLCAETAQCSGCTNNEFDPQEAGGQGRIRD